MQATDRWINLLARSVEDNSPYSLFLLMHTNYTGVPQTCSQTQRQVNMDTQPAPALLYYS